MGKTLKTRAEREYHGRLASLPCVLCEALGQPQTDPTQVHHIREGQGTSQRASHWLTIPLCTYCHSGKHGIHGDRALLRIAGVSELDLLAMTVERVAGWAA